jgi:hypothetical protein
LKIFIAILILFYTTTSHADEINKAESVRCVLKTTEEIFNLATTNDSSNIDHIKNEVEKVLSQLKNLDQLASFAVISDNIAWPQEAGDIRFDQWFEEAFWQAVERISKVKTKEGKETMESLKGRLFLDGGASLTFKNFAAQQNDMPLSEYDPSCSLEAIHNKRMMQRKLIEKKKKVTQKNKKSGGDRGGVIP